MISKNDKSLILKYAKKYKLTRVILFGSSLYRDLSKPLDVIDLSKDCLFNELIKRDGVVLYG
jgi:hypothetical protein